MKKILVLISMSMVLTSGVMASKPNSKQTKDNYSFGTLIDTKKLTPCPQYKEVSQYSRINTHTEIVSHNPSNIKTEIFKDGFSLSLMGCMDKSHRLKLKISNTIYKTAKE